MLSWKPTTSSNIDSGTGFSFEFEEIRKKPFFYKHLETNASEEPDLLQETRFVMLQVFIIDRTDNSNIYYKIPELLNKMIF